MANRTYLYITDDVEKREKIRGIAEYNYDFPLLFKIMCSTEPVPGKSSIFNLEEKAAIISEMSGGIDKIKSFLLKMKEEKSTLGSGKELVGSETCEKIMEFLDENKFLDEGYRYFLLEAAELYEMEADSHKEFEKLTLRDIEEINNTVKDVEYFMETGILNDSILEKIGTYEKFQYELSSFSEYLYYDFSSTYDKEIEDVQYAEIEKAEKIVRKRLMNFDYREIMFMIFFLLIFPPLGLYFCYDGFRGRYDDRYTSGLFLGFLGTVLMLFYLWKITDIIFG